MNSEYIVSQAVKLAKSFDRDPYDAAFELGAVISFKDLGSLKGAFFGSMPTPAIVINSELDSVMRSIVCAHELGHFVLHKSNSFSCESIGFDKRSAVGTFEREANIFAAAFLIDGEKATALLKEGYSASEVSAILGTDVNLLMFLLNTQGICEAPDSTFLKS